MAPSFIAVAVIPLGVWIYLAFMVWKKKSTIFHDLMEPESAERRLRILKRFLLVGGVSLVVGMVVVPLWIVLFGETEEEGGVLFWIPFSLVWVFLIGTFGGLVTFLMGRRKAT
ncbi:MAG: hypothetical protein ACXABY_24350 [Candidatus Thorarchaeota archaeon]|jgi:hypothetical protein